MLAITLVCVTGVAVAAWWRFVRAPSDPLGGERRGAIERASTRAVR
jgi:hypothetical protein